jgi:hypothetical protein
VPRRLSEEELEAKRAEKDQVVLECWILAAQWDFLQAPEKYHFKAV